MSTLNICRDPWRVMVLRLSVGILLLGLMSPLSADTKLGETLTLTEALARVLRDNPDLARFPYALRAAEAETLQARLRPNPELSVELENFAGNGEFSGRDSTETTLALSQVIEMGNKRQLRGNVAVLRRDSLDADYEIARLDVMAKAATRFLEVAQLQMLQAFARQMVDFTATAESVAARRYKAGSASRAELSRARTEMMQARLAEQSVAVQLINAKRSLSRLWGQVAPDFTRAEADLFHLEPIPNVATLEKRLDLAPKMKRLLTLKRMRQAELDLAVARGRQDIQLGAGVRRVEETGDNALLLQFSMPLGIFNRNQGGVQSAREQLAALEQEKSATRVRVVTQLRNTLALLELSRTEVTTLRDQILPEAEQALRLVRDGYAEGRFSYLELVEARRQLLSVKTGAVAAATRFHQTLITLEALTGQPLTEQGVTS